MPRFMTFVAALAFSWFPFASTSVAVKRWGVPLPSCTDFTPFVYSGCFTDPPDVGALSYRTDLDFNNMTIEACVDFCKGNDYRYAGLEYYGECFCGATVAGALVDDSNCGAPCTGNSTEICGGNQYISIYQDPTFPPVNDSTISDYIPQGCYSEGVGGRALEYQQNINGSTITVEECLFACKDNGFAFAGVEYASQCFCSVVLGNGTVPLDSSQCNMACNGDPSEMCGGSGTLNLYVATDLESTEPCGSNITSSSSSSSTSSTSTSSTSTSPTSTSPTSTSPTSTSPTSTSPTSTSPTSTSATSTSATSTSPTSTSATSTSPTSTSTTSKTVSLCTSTTTISPTPTCEYKCGGWCSNPLPPFSDNPSCNTAASNCAIQLTSCFLGAGFPDSLNCFQYASWCSSISSYCSSYCPGSQCSLSNCKSKYPPSGTSPSPIVSSVVYTCSPTTTSTKPASSTTSKSTSTSCVPVPTQACMCTQPSNPGKGYTSSSPVGSISLPCLTCNNLQSDYNAGNLFKLYTSPNSQSCPSYPQPSVPQGCKDACDTQHTACLNTYAEGCKSNSAYEIAHLGYDSYSSACTKCTNQWNDCYTANAGVSHGNRCSSWNSGWY